MTESPAPPVPRILPRPIHRNRSVGNHPIALFHDDASLCACGPGVHQVDCEIDVPSRSFAVRTGLVCAVQNRLRDLPIQAREADVKAGFEEVTIASCVKIYFGINGDVSRQLHFHFGGNHLYRTQEEDDQPAANNCSGFVLLPGPPGTESFTSSRPSEEREEPPSRPPVVCVWRCRAIHDTGQRE
jgi:hypothetical protein